MAASTLTVASYFINNFRPDIRGDTQATELVFSQTDIGRPFFYACEDPNMVGFIYTNKRGLVTHKHLHVKSHFTREVVSTDLLRRVGVADHAQNTIPHLIAKYWLTPTTPHFRSSSDSNAISLTVIQSDGTRGDMRLNFYAGENDHPVLVTAADLTHVYSSSYDRYYWCPTALIEPRADPIPGP